MRDNEGLATRFGATIRSVGVMIDVNWIFGGEFLTPESYQPGGKWESALFSPENIRAYEAVLDAFYVDRIAPNPGSEPQWAKGSAGSLLDGGLAMDWTGWWSVTSIVQAGDTGNSYGFAPPPKVESRNATLFNDPWFMSSRTDNPDAAWEFIKFATSTEALMKYSELQGTPPARHSSFIEGYLPAFSKALKVSGPDLLEAFMGSTMHGRYRHEFEDMGVDPFITPLLLPIVTGEKPLQSGLEEAHRQLGQFLEEQQAHFNSAR